MPLIHMLGRGEFDLALALTWVLALALGITVHEFAHAYRAEKAGDPTPRAAGRISFNPLHHYDPIGTTLILLFGLGWAKPVPVNPAMFRRPRRDEIMVSLWGPLSNVILAVVLAIPIWLGVAGVYARPLETIILLQVILAVFNLIPVHPLDGSHILTALLPVEQARKLDAIYQQYGLMLLLLVIILGREAIWSVIRTLWVLLLNAPAIPAAVATLLAGLLGR